MSSAVQESSSHAAARERYISQKQYKRKIRRESAGSGQPGYRFTNIIVYCSSLLTLLSRYGTLDTRTERRLTNGHDKARGCTKIVSKTTYKLKKFNGATSELDSAGEENYERSNGLELMEIPLSPTHYDQPPTPEHAPPSAWEAESAIHSVLSFLKSEYNPRARSAATITEPWMMLSLDKAEWPPENVDTRDATTSTRPEAITGRALPDLPRDTDTSASSGGQRLVSSSAMSSEDEDSADEVILRPKQAPVEDRGDIYQTIGDDSDSDCENGNKVSDYPTPPPPVIPAPEQPPPILSPFDEQEEWSKISQIINSFGADIGKQTADTKDAVGKEMTTPNNSPVYDYPTLKRREKLAGTVSEWLRYINMEKYTTNFEGHGYDNINFMGGGVMTKDDLTDIGITDVKDASVLIDSLKDRSNDFNFDSNGLPKTDLLKLNVTDWLKRIKLEQYVDNFKDNLMTEMERIIDIWDEELVSILEIDRVGHRKRILLSVAGPKGLKKRCGKIDTIRRKSVDKSIKNKAKGSPESSGTKKKTSSSSPTEDSLVRSVSSADGGQSGGAYSATESDVSLSYPTSSASRRYTSTSSTSDTSSEKPPTPSKAKRTSVESGTLTLGRKKKKAPPPPTTPSQVSPQLRSKELHKILDDGKKSKGHHTIERSGVRSKEREKIKLSKPAFSASFKANYHGNNLVKEFNGIETTREAIEKVKSSKDIINRTGMPVTMMITEKDVKVAIFEGQDPIQQHLITNICCIVYDTDNMCMFGYITSDVKNMQRHSHVFSAENKERASEILTAICKGYKEGATKSQNKERDKGKDTIKKSSSGATKKKPSEVELRKVSSGSDIKENRSSRSDQLVTRMRNFFQVSFLCM